METTLEVELKDLKPRCNYCGRMIKKDDFNKLIEELGAKCKFNLAKGVFICSQCSHGELVFYERK